MEAGSGKGGPMNRVDRVVCVWVMGFSFVIAQVLVLREFIVLFHGNELSIGIVLGNWLLFEALGSVLAGRWADRARDPGRTFGWLQATVAVLLPVTLLLIRAGRQLVGISPWEAVGPGEIWRVSVLLLGPIGVVDGAEFAYACRAFFRLPQEETGVAGRVYLLEAVGSVCGGLLFTYLFVGRLHAVQTALVVGAVNAASALFLLGWRRGDRAGGTGRDPRHAQPADRGRGALALASLVLLSAACVALAGSGADRLEAGSERLRWKGLPLVGSAESVYGNVTVFRLGEQFSFYQNGIPAITVPVPDIAAIEERVHLSLLAHPDPERVLMLGGGLGGGLAEALRHPVREIFYMEPDPEVVEMVRRFPTPLTERELGDPRVRVRNEDGRRFLRNTDLPFDVVLLHLPDATTLLQNRYFTREFFALVKARLRPGGLLALTLPGSSSYLGEELILLTRCTRDTLREELPHTRILPGEQALVLASADLPLEALGPDLLARRLEARGIEASMVSPYYIRYRMDPERERWYLDEIEKGPGTPVNRDLAPVRLYYALAYRNAQVHRGGRAATLALTGLRSFHVFVALAVLQLPLLVWLLLGRGDRVTALSFSVFSTGFASMAVEMTLILSFQCLFGQIYQWVGVLIASFMGGLALGAYRTSRPGIEAADEGLRRFVRLERWVLLFLLGLIPALAGVARAPLWGGGAAVLLHAFYVIAAAACGFLVGSEFPLANREALRHRAGVSRMAGRFYALDLAGAWLGTLLVSVILVPLLGVLPTLAAACLLKVFSLLYLRLAP